MNKIVIFGASGTIGQWATKCALRKDMMVRILLRDPSTMPEELRSQVEVCTGDVTNAADVEKAVDGMDAVVVTLGTRTDLGPTTMMSQGMKNIIAAMKKSGVETVSVCLSAFLFFETDKVPKLFTEVNADHQRMLDVLKASGVKWIAVLPPHFTDNPSAKFTVQHDASPGRTISKEDLGCFMVDSLSQPEHHNRICGIATDV